MTTVVLFLALSGCALDDTTQAYTGTVEVTEVQAAATVGGRLVTVTPREGDRVTAGETLFTVDRDMLEAQEALRVAGVEQATAAREAALAQVRAAKAGVTTLEREVERVKALEARGVATAQQSSQLSGQLDVARAQLAAARKLVEQADAAGHQAEAGLSAARTQLDQSDVAAPIDGVVLSRNREPGEVIGPGVSVLTIGDLDHPRLRIYVPLLKVETLAIGQPVEVQLDAATASGRIERIASEAEFTPREILTPEERVKRVFAVDIALEPGPGVHPGMPAEAILPEG